MNSFINSLAVNPYFVVIISVSGLFGTFFGFYSHFKNKTNKRLGYSSTNFTLVNEKLSCVNGLNITYKDNLIKSLSVVAMCIRNKGNVSLRNIDFYEKYPLEVCLSNKEEIIIDIEIDELSTDTCEFEIRKINEKNWRIEFKYFENKDFLNLRIYHTGTEDSDIYLRGKIIDGTIKKFESLEDMNRFVERIFFTIMEGSLFGRVLIEILRLFGRKN